MDGQVRRHLPGGGGSEEAVEQAARLSRVGTDTEQGAAVRDVPEHPVHQEGRAPAAV